MSSVSSPEILSSKVNVGVAIARMPQHNDIYLIACVVSHNLGKRRQESHLDKVWISLDAPTTPIAAFAFRDYEFITNGSGFLSSSQHPSPR